MPAPKKITAENIARCENLCRQALTLKGGLEIEFDSKAKALHYRQSIYSARRVKRDALRTGDSSMEQVELKLEQSGDKWKVIIRKQGYAFHELVVRDAITGERISLEDKIVEAARSPIPTDDEILNLEFYYSMYHGLNGDAMRDKAIEAFRQGWRCEYDSDKIYNILLDQS